MSERLLSKLMPVLRRPRRDWTIPAPDAYERMVKEKQEAARLKEYWQGTTPYGREIFRRILHLAWKLCEQNPSMPEVIPQVEAELKRFEDLRDEFILMLSKELDIKVEECQGLSLRGMAMQLVLRSRHSQWLNRQVADNPRL